MLVAARSNGISDVISSAEAGFGFPSDGDPASSASMAARLARQHGSGGGYHKAAHGSVKQNWLGLL